MAGRLLLYTTGDIEPAALLEELKIALLVRIEVGQADQIEAGRNLHREPGERHAARLLPLMHQKTGNVGDAAGRNVVHFDASGMHCLANQADWRLIYTR